MSHWSYNTYYQYLNMDEFEDLTCQDDTLEVNFSSDDRPDDIPNNSREIIETVSQTFTRKVNLYDKLYNHRNYDYQTKEYYKILRERKMDPISQEELDDKYAFKFKYMWDPYTGERLDEDPYGALCFDPDMLIKHFVTNKVRKLWINSIDETGGTYQGVYDDGVGAGEEFFVSSRGSHPEWYLFRLPIIDCYLSTDHNNQIITLGPILTMDELMEIHEKSKIRKNHYATMFNINRPDLMNIVKLYLNAISKKPTIDGDAPTTDVNGQPIKENDMDMIYATINRKAVTSLLKIKG